MRDRISRKSMKSVASASVSSPRNGLFRGVPPAGWWAAAGLALAVGTAAAFQAWGMFRPAERLPLWDMAGHGWLGVELLRDLQAGGPFRFLLDLNAQDKWPFGYSLLLVPFLAAGGASYASAAALSVLLYAGVPMGLVAAARQVERGWRGLCAGALAAGLWISSPLPRVLAVVVLREMGGVVTLLAAFTLYLRARRRGSLGAWRLAGGATLAVILVKWSYGAVWVFATALHELLRLPPARRREVLAQGLRVLVPWGGKAPAARALALALDSVVLAAVLGINPGALVWSILVIGAVALARRMRRGELEPGRWLAGLPARLRASVETVVLPLGLWWLSPLPIHPKDAFNFIRNRGGGVPREPADLLYYVRDLAADYALRPEVGWAVLGLAAAGLGLAAVSWRGEGGRRRRFLLLWTAVSFALVSLHPHKEPRYLATTAPFLFLLASFSLVDLLAGARPDRGRRWVAGAVVAGLALAALATGPLGRGRAWLDARWQEEFAAYSGDPRLEQALEAVARAVGPARRVGVVGVFDELSADLIRWDLHQRRGLGSPEVLELPRGLAARKSVEELRIGLQSWLAEEEIERVVVLALAAESPFARRDDYRLHNAWQAAPGDRLVEALAPAGPPRRLPELGVTVRVLDPGRPRERR